MSAGKLVFRKAAPSKVILFALFLFFRSPSLNLQEKPRLVIAVPAQVSWTDTGLEVEEGEELIFRASGTISLQVGNPDGFCDPDGLNFQTAQQPLPAERLGILIGRVTRLLSTEVDPKTKEEIRHEETKVFPIGKERRVLMPLTGRLYLGVNENVVEDNSGEFLVVIQRKRLSSFMAGLKKLGRDHSLRLTPSTFLQR
ncbi:MAG: hypothetical protein ACUVWQ_08575, partial [Candidatus Aminicenantales bacterium]